MEKSKAQKSQRNCGKMKNKWENLYHLIEIYNLLYSGRYQTGTYTNRSIDLYYTIPIGQYNRKSK